MTNVINLKDHLLNQIEDLLIKSGIDTDDINLEIQGEWQFKIARLEG